MADEPATELLDRARGGDPQAFDELVRPHLDSLRRLVLSHTKSAQDTDDVVQDALLRAFRSIARFDRRAALATWLHVVARNACIDFQRSRLGRAAQREKPLLSSQPAGGATEEDLLANKQEVVRLQIALAELDERSRVPLVLHEIDGLSYEQIAALEGVPVGTVRSRLSRARQNLRDIMSEQRPAAKSGVYARLSLVPKPRRDG